MKRAILFLCLVVFTIIPFFLLSQVTRDSYYSVTQLYTDPAIQDGADIQVLGYFTDTVLNYLVEFYGDYDLNEPFAPHSLLILTGITPPDNAWNGGLILASGIVTFEDEADHYHPEDSLMAYLNVYEITVILPAESLPASPLKDNKQKNPSGQDDNRSMNSGTCDPCKFAFLLSGGVNNRNNHSKYWESLVALYKFKVDSLGYCDSNVFVHYYKGTPRDNRIPASRVIGATGTKIDSSFQKIADRVAACNAAGTPATFQKLISNHGQADGDICLTSVDGVTEVITPEHLKANQQKVIDSCCRTVYDEFLQCYAGHVVDAVETLNTKNKATVYANSSADHTSSHSPHDVVDPYLAAKILSLDTGASYPAAVVNAKLAYDAYLQQKINEAHNRLMALRAMDPATPGRDAAIAKWLADSTDRAGKICKSRNVTVVPFTTYCQWREVVVPPGGQIVVEFEGGSNSCGNVTVYRRDPVTGELVKVAVWNWNHPGSAGYQPGNERRAINGQPTESSTFMIHNDNDTSRVTVRALGTPFYPESPSNISTYPGFSFGGTDNSSAEFMPIPIPNYFVEDIGQLNLSLTTLPARMGPGFVQNFGFTFQLDQTNPFWSDIELILRIFNVATPGQMIIQVPGSNIPATTVDITEPGLYVVPLGDFSMLGPFGFMSMMTMTGLQMEFDSWGLRSALDGAPAMTTAWLGLISTEWSNPENWSNGVPGLFHDVMITPAPFSPVIVNEVTLKSLTIMPEAVIITAEGGNLILTGH